MAAITPLLDDFVDPRPGTPKYSSEGIDTHSQRTEEIFAQDLSRVLLAYVD